MKKIVIWSMVLLLAGTALAETQVLDKPADWVQSAQFKDGVGRLAGKGYRFFESKAMIPVVPGARYTIGAEVRAASGKIEICSINLTQYDAKQKPISPYSVGALKNTETALAAEAPAGALTVMIKDGANWKPSGCIAFNAKADYSDLPNRDVIEIKSIEKKENSYEITLAKPLVAAYSADTAVRRHEWSSLWLGHDAAAKNLGSDWMKITGKINGIVSKGEAKSNQLWPGAAFLRVVIYYRGADEQSALEVKNVTFDAESPADAIFF